MFFVCGSPLHSVADDHILAQVDQVLNLGCLRKEEEAEFYASNFGCLRIAPESVLRLMLSGFQLETVYTGCSGGWLVSVFVAPPSLEIRTCRLRK